MKILNKLYKNLIDGPGIVKLRPEDTEDLWYAYNLISKGDTVKCASVRKFIKEAEYSKDDMKINRDVTSRVKVKLEICVEVVEYDNVAATLRIRGKNISENEFVKIGQFHTQEIELHRPFEIRKKVWDSMAIDILRQAANPAASADLAVVLITEGLANIFLVGRNITTNSCRIQASIPRKHGRGMASYESVLNHFFGNVLQAFLRHVDFKVVRCAVIAGPGLTNEQFNKHLLREAERKNLRSIIENKSKLLLARANSAYKHSLGDVLDDPKVMKLIKDTNAAKEVKVLDKFFEMLSNDQDRAWYGPKHVEVANERMAIDVLLITDELFRNSDVVTRKKYVELVQSVKNTGGEALIFSSMHVSGERLAQISGIAAILRFPLPDLEDMDI